MVILITGASHVGKTVLAQRMLEKHKYPSVDIVALIEKDNTASISLFKKLGFIEECFADSIQSYVFIINGNAN